MVNTIMRAVSEFHAYNESGEWSLLAPGDTFLVVDENEYDVAMLAYGEVIYTARDTIESRAEVQVA